MFRILEAMRATKAAQLAASILKNILDRAYHLLCSDQSSGGAKTAHFDNNTKITHYTVQAFG